MNECPCPLYTPGSRDTKDPPYSSRSPSRPPGMNASFYRLRGWPGWGRAGRVENWIGGRPLLLLRPPRGFAFPDVESLPSLPKTRLQSRDSHDQPHTAAPYPISAYRLPAYCAGVQSPQLPIGRSSPSFPSIGRDPVAAPPSASLRWYSLQRFRRGGKVQCVKARGSLEEPDEAERSLWNVSVGPTRPVEAWCGLAASSERQLLIS